MGLMRTGTNLLYNLLALDLLWPVIQHLSQLYIHHYPGIWITMNQIHDSNLLNVLWSVSIILTFQQVYEYHRLLIQFLCYKKRGFSIEKNHCPLKCPFHVLNLSSFLKVYKNARVIIIYTLKSQWSCSIYAQYQLKYTKEFDQKITEYLQQNPQGKHGRHKYSLADYDLLEIELRY